MAEGGEPKPDIMDEIPTKRTRSSGGTEISIDKDEKREKRRGNSLRKSSATSDNSNVDRLVDDVKAVKSSKSDVNKKLAALLKNQVKVTEDFSKAMKEKLSKKDSRIQDLKGDVSDLKRKLSSMETGLSGSSGQSVKKIAELESELSRARRHLEREQKRKLLSPIPEEGAKPSSISLLVLLTIGFNLALMIAVNPTFSTFLGVPDSDPVLTPLRSFLGVDVDLGNTRQLLRQKTSNLVTCSQNRTDLERWVSEWRTKHSECKQETQTLLETKKRLETSNGALERGLDQTQNQIEGLQREVGVCRTSQMAVTERNRYTTEIQQCNDSLNQANLKSSKLQFHLDSSAESLETASKQATKCKLQKSQCEDSLAESDTKLRKLTREVGFIKDYHSTAVDQQVLKLKGQVNSCTDSLEGANSQVRKLKRDLEDVNDVRTKLQFKSNDCADSLVDVNKQLNREKNRIVELTERNNDDLESVMKKSKQLLVECTSSLNNAKQQVREQKDSIATSAKRTSICISTLDTTKQQIRSLNNQLSTLESTKQQVQALNDEVNKVERKASHCASSLKVSEENVHDFKNQLHKMKRVHEESKTDHAETQMKLKKEQESNADTKKACKKDIQSLHSQVDSTLSDCKEKVKKNKKKMASDCEERIKQKKKKADGMLNKLDSKYKAASRQVETLKADVTKVKSCVEQRRQINEQKNRIANKLKQVQKELGACHSPRIPATLNQLSQSVDYLASHDNRLMSSMYSKLQQCQDNIQSCNNNATLLTDCLQRSNTCSSSLNESMTSTDSHKDSFSKLQAQMSVYESSLGKCSSAQDTCGKDLKNCQTSVEDLISQSSELQTSLPDLKKQRTELQTCTENLQQLESERSMLLAAGESESGDTAECQGKLASLDGILTSTRQNMTLCQNSVTECQDLQKQLDEDISTCTQEKNKFQQAEANALKLQKFIVGKLSVCQNSLKQGDLSCPDVASTGNSGNSVTNCQPVIQKANQECVHKIAAVRSSIEKIVLLEAGARKAYFSKMKDTNTQQVECLEKLASIQDNLGEQQYNNTVLLRELRHMRTTNGAYRRNSGATAQGEFTTNQMQLLRTQVVRETEVAMEKKMASEKQSLDTQRQDIASKMSGLEIKAYELKQEEDRLHGHGSRPEQDGDASSVYVRQLQTYMDGLQSFRKDLRETAFQTSNMASTQDLQVTTKTWLNNLVSECNSRLAAATQKTDQILSQLQALQTQIRNKNFEVAGGIPDLTLSTSDGLNMTDTSLDSIIAHWKNFKFQRWPMSHKILGLLCLVCFDVVLFQLLLPTDSIVCVLLTLILHGGLVYQCILHNNWICTALFSCNVILGLVFLIKPGWALRFSCSNGYITITS